VAMSLMSMTEGDTSFNVDEAMDQCHQEQSLSADHIADQVDNTNSNLENPDERANQAYGFLFPRAAKKVATNQGGNIIPRKEEVNRNLALGISSQARAHSLKKDTKKNTKTMFLPSSKRKLDGGEGILIVITDSEFRLFSDLVLIMLAGSTLCLIFEAPFGYWTTYWKLRLHHCSSHPRAEAQKADCGGDGNKLGYAWVDKRRWEPPGPCRANEGKPAPAAPSPTTSQARGVPRDKRCRGRHRRRGILSGLKAMPGNGRRSQREKSSSRCAGADFPHSSFVLRSSRRFRPLDNGWMRAPIFCFPGTSFAAVVNRLQISTNEIRNEPQLATSPGLPTWRRGARPGGT
jgi:hypothetical protein